MTVAPDDLDIREQIASIDRMLVGFVRKRQDVPCQVWIFIVSGMSVGAALFAAGAALFKLLT